MAPVLEVFKVALVGVCLTFKRDVTVSIPAHGQPCQPLDHIGKIKEQEKHLALLCRVDALMVDQLMAQVHSGMHKEDSQQIDGREPAERQYPCPDDLHGCKGTIY